MAALRRKGFLLDQRIPHGYRARFVDGQYPNRGPSDRRLAPQNGSIPGEVRRPLVTPRVEQSDDLSTFGIDSSDIGAFVRVASGTSQAEIAPNGLAAVLSCDDVIDGKAETIGGLWQAAVFADVAGTFTHPVVKVVVHERQEARPRRRSDRRAFDCNTASRSATRRYS